MTSQDLAHMLRTIRRRLDLSQEEAATYYDVSPRTYRAWEAGRGLDKIARFITGAFRLQDMAIQRAEAEEEKTCRFDRYAGSEGP